MDNKVVAAGVQIEPEPGGWRITIPAAGEGTEQPACSVLLLEADAPGPGRRLLQALAQQPLKLAALQEAGATSIAGLLPKTPPWQPAEGPRAAAAAAAARKSRAAMQRRPHARARQHGARPRPSSG